MEKVGGAVLELPIPPVEPPPNRLTATPPQKKKTCKI